MTAGPDAVVKVGGSLLRDGSPDALCAALGELGRRHRLVVVPGGGAFADSVRRAAELHDLGATTAHLMAVLAMDQCAHLLAGAIPGATLTADPAEVAAAHGAGRLPVLAPFVWLRAADPLPHGWDVTSDSIALWIGSRLRATRVVLLKAGDIEEGAGVNAEGPGRDAAPLTASAQDLARAGVVDAYFPRVLDPSVDCWILNGRRPDRLRELLERGSTTGSRVR